MKLSVLVVAVGLVSLLVGTYYAAGWPWVLVVAGVLFVAAGLLINVGSR
jgi:hypothetical protein